MRKISYAVWLRNVQLGLRLTPDEQREILEAIRSQRRGPKTWNEYETVAMRLGELVAKANGCQCLDDIREQYRLVVENFRNASGGNIQLLQDVSHPSHKEHWRQNTNLAKRLARQRRCHSLMRGFVCYCDEHQHPF